MYLSWWIAGQDHEETESFGSNSPRCGGALLTNQPTSLKDVIGAVLLATPCQLMSLFKIRLRDCASEIMVLLGWSGWHSGYFLAYNLCDPGSNSVGYTVWIGVSVPSRLRGFPPRISFLVFPPSSKNTVKVGVKDFIKRRHKEINR